MKKDSKGETHGSAAERILAANRPDFKPMMVAPMNVMNSGKMVYSDMGGEGGSFPPPPPPSMGGEMGMMGGEYLPPPPPPQAYP